MAWRTSSNLSFSSAVDDIDYSLMDALASSTVSVAADNFLRFASLQMLWNSPDWNRMLTQLAADETQEHLKQSWNGISNESDQYKPFCEWVEHLITYLTQLPNQQMRQISFLPRVPSIAQEQKVPRTSAVLRPDAVCVPKDVEEFSKWSQVLVPIKFANRTAPALSDNTAPSTSSPDASDVPPTTSTSQSQSDSKESGDCRDKNTQRKDARASSPSALPSSGPAGSPYSPTIEDIKLARYAMETFGAVGDRTHVFGLIVERPTVALWYFDRCGALCTPALNVMEPKGFLPFLKFLSTLVYTGDGALGFNPFFADPATNTPAGLRESLGGLTLNIPDFENASLRLQEEVIRRTGLVSRATLVWKAELRETEGENGGAVQDVVIKSSWQHSARTLESKVLLELHKEHQARDYIVWCFHGWEQPGATGSSQRAKFGQSGPQVVDERALRHTVLEYLGPVTDLSQPFHIPSIGWSIMQAIRFLNDMQWYHCDISVGNIGFRFIPNCGGVSIKLHDFDLAKHHHTSNSGGPHPMGTLPFMSIELLERPNAPQMIGFEVEALCWTLFWIVRVYTNGEDKHTDEDHPLRDWFANGRTPESIALSKCAYLRKVVGYTNEFYRDMEGQFRDLARTWHLMLYAQWNERHEQRNDTLLSESLYGMLGFNKFQDWMESKGWNTPKQPCTCGKHSVQK